MTSGLAASMLAGTQSVRASQLQDICPYNCKYGLAIADDSPRDLRTPNGRTPGRLSKAMRQQEVNAAGPSNDTSSAQIRCANKASASQKSVDRPLKEVHIICHAAVSNPEGPADPLQQ